MNTVSAGIQIGNTTVTTYIVDCYPQHAMAVITFYSVLLNLSAFVDPVGSPTLRFCLKKKEKKKKKKKKKKKNRNVKISYGFSCLNLGWSKIQFFIAAWVDGVGYTWAFTGHALITCVVMIPVTIALYKFGGVWRTSRGEPASTGSEPSWAVFFFSFLPILLLLGRQADMDLCKVV